MPRYPGKVRIVRITSVDGGQFRYNSRKRTASLHLKLDGIGRRFIGGPVTFSGGLCVSNFGGGVIQTSRWWPWYRNRGHVVMIFMAWTSRWMKSLQRQTSTWEGLVIGPKTTRCWTLWLLKKKHGEKKRREIVCVLGRFCFFPQGRFFWFQRELYKWVYRWRWSKDGPKASGGSFHLMYKLDHWEWKLVWWMSYFFCWSTAAINHILLWF